MQSLELTPRYSEHTPCLNEAACVNDTLDQYGPLFDRIAQLDRLHLSEQAIIQELEKLGLTPNGLETPIWHLLTQSDWLQLLRGIARYSPKFAFALAECRVTRSNQALKVLHNQPLKDISISEIAMLSSGCVWHAWETCMQHAQTRPMFRRHLADFPAIQLRLLKVLIQVLRVDEWASLLVGTQNLRTRKRASTALRYVADKVRIETQLICGGTGYMRESAYASALSALQVIDDLLRGLPSTDTRVFSPLQKKVDAALQAKLMRVAPDLIRILDPVVEKCEGQYDEQYNNTDASV